MLAGCFKNKMSAPEIQILEKTVKLKKESSQEEFCKYISSVISYQRNTLGRRYVGPPPLVSFYAIECLENNMLDQKFFLFNKPATKHNLLYRSAICGEENAIELVKSQDKEFSPRFRPMFDGKDYYLEDNNPLGPSSDKRFPYASIDEEIFCGYAETEFTAVGMLATPIVLIPTLIIGAPFVIIGGVVYIISLGTVNLFH